MLRFLLYLGGFSLLLKILLKPSRAARGRAPGETTMNENKMAEALELREEWLRVAGLSEPEARELARAEVPGLDVEEERANLAAARRLADDTATTSTLLALAKRSARARQRSAEADGPRPAVPT